MRSLKRTQPAALFCYFAAVTLTAVFCTSPAIRGISLAGGLAALIAAGEVRRPKDLAGYGVIFLMMTALNPVIVTYGNTPLFYLTDRPYTLEALLYGANNGLAMTAALMWFRLFSVLMTSDKIGTLMTGSVLNSFGTALKLTLRYVPDLRLRYREIREAHKAAGLLAADTWIVRVRSELNVFMSLTACSLELSARTADSMKARGYTLPDHTSLAKRPRRLADFLLTALSAGAAVCVCTAVRGGRLYAAFYPEVKTECPLYAAFVWAALCGVPLLSVIKEQIKWRSFAPKG